ncbi:helix-turn-helix domain-containing protein [Paenirhodobacter populi]|uniref:XRE family transcriptional regulator n=1 Tax=Paenirhodobacter populi TaxID=2306993 RepID=A0A443JA66_9RHOB|nr:helix-turn-helix transcriptional regulator [Sinirhodobacter populi]RWR17309.1 XRE family transcriptional regulator [Sinirhodobacter populi]
MERTNAKLIKAFAKVLKRRRRAAGLSQEELAFRTDLSPSYISLLETANRQPTLTVLAELSDRLGIDLPELIAEITAEQNGQPPGHS